MKLYCPECETRYQGDERELCPDDGSRLFRLDSPDDEGDPLIDTLVDDRFRIKELVGTGGMGAVYRGLQLSVQRQVAIKVLRPELVDREVMLERFFREAKVVSELTHPNIVRLVDFGQDEQLDLLYLVMELVEGLDLGELLDRGRLDPNLALEIIYQICGALTEPHRRGIVHRDLKPENMIIMPITDGTLQVKVLDFGIARALESTTQLTQTGMICGTPAYMSPEQAQNHELDGRSDLYALGVILFEMLTGRPPFSGESSLQILLEHVQQPTPDLAAVAPEGKMPVEIAELVGRLMAKDPDQRPETAREVRDRIDTLRRQLDLRPVRLDADDDIQRAFDVWISPRFPMPELDDETPSESELSSDEIARTLASAETGELARGRGHTGDVDKPLSETEREFIGVAETAATSDIDAGTRDRTSTADTDATQKTDDQPSDPSPASIEDRRRHSTPTADPSTTTETTITDVLTHPAVVALGVIMFLTLGIIVGLVGYFVVSGELTLPGDDPTAQQQIADDSQPESFEIATGLQQARQTTRKALDEADEKTSDDEFDDDPVAETDHPTPERQIAEPGDSSDPPSRPEPPSPSDDEDPSPSTDQSSSSDTDSDDRDDSDVETPPGEEETDEEPESEHATPPRQLGTSGDDETAEDDESPTGPDEPSADDSPDEDQPRQTDDEASSEDPEEETDEDVEDDRQDGDELRDRLDRLRQD